MSRRMLQMGLILGIALAVGRMALSAPGDPQSPAKSGSPPHDRAVKTKDSKLKALLKERLATLRKLVDQTTADYKAGRVSFDRVHQAMAAMLRAELELCASDKERIAVLKKIVAQAQEHEQHANGRYKAGQVSSSDALMATADRLEAEIALERAKSKAPAQPK